MDKAFSLFPRLKERQKQKGVPSRAANNRCRQLVGP
jgi:ABC-type branched-subunit amino acid transport system ATPase component